MTPIQLANKIIELHGFDTKHSVVTATLLYEKVEPLLNDASFYKEVLDHVNKYHSIYIKMAIYNRNLKR